MINCRCYIFLVLFINIVNIKAQYYSKEDYINKYKKIAVEEMKRSGIPASITLAQGMLESENGNSTLAFKSNNHFGIKCHKNWEGKRVYHDDDKDNECFRKYPSPKTRTGTIQISWLIQADTINFSNINQMIIKVGPKV